MVDLFALVLMHAILALAAFRLLMRPDLDTEPDPGETAKPELSSNA